jgi:2'-phosphotransferase
MADPDSLEPQSTQHQGRPSKGKGNQKGKGGNKGQPSGGTKLRGLEKDSPQVRTSKTLSWLLRHGAASEGLAIRADGYVQVNELVSLHVFCGLSVSLAWSADD